MLKQKTIHSFFLLATPLIIIFSFLLYRTPDLGYFLMDPDGGTFLQGASQIIKAGEHPQANFLQLYGPLSFEIRAFFMLVLGDRLSSEVFYVCLFYGIGYWLLYRMALVISGSFLFSLALTILALLFFPRYYKVFVVFCPMLTLTAASLFINNGSTRSSILLGLSVSIATLFRQDVGAYCFFAALLAILMTSEKKQRVANVCKFILGAAFISVPWILFVEIYGSVLDYVTVALRGSASVAGGLSLPHPLLHWQGDASIYFLIIYSLPLISAVSLAFSHNLLNRKEIALFSTAIFLALLCLIQSMHRADISHALQGGAPSLLCIAILYRCTRLNNKLYPLLIGSVSASFYACNLLLSNWQPIPVHSAANVFSNIGVLLTDRQKIVDASADTYGIIPVVRLIQSCTTPEDMIQVLPYSPHVIYFAGRAAGGKTSGIGPGYFENIKDQETIIGSLVNEKVKLILWNEAAAYDNMQSRMPINTHSLVHAFVTSAYDRTGSLGGYTIFELKGSGQSCGNAL